MKPVLPLFIGCVRVWGVRGMVPAGGGVFIWFEGGSVRVAGVVTGVYRDYEEVFAFAEMELLVL